MNKISAILNNISSELCKIYVCQWYVDDWEKVMAQFVIENNCATKGIDSTPPVNQGCGNTYRITWHYRKFNCYYLCIFSQDFAE
jgi:hypothetical protein